MNRNRHSSGAVGLGPLLVALVCCLGLSGAGMGYVWHRNRNGQLEDQLQQWAGRLERLRQDNQVLDQQLEELRSPQALEAAVRRWNLGLTMPQPEQILRVTEPQPGTTVSNASHGVRVTGAHPTP